jgi:hypothetical protein
MIKDFITLFRGRGDCYGSWDGGCVREPLTPDMFASHLGDGPHIGVYPCVNVRGETMCVWGCTDIDYPNPDDAWMLHDALLAVGVTSWVERTRRGYHVWVFATELLPAKHMRRMFLAAHQVTGLNPKEVNPKQEKLSPNQVGNYVRLPYPASGLLGERVVVYRDGNNYQLEDFMVDAMNSRVTPETVEKLSEYYTPPVISFGNTQPTNDMLEASRMLTPLGRTIFRDGPIVGRDRSTTLTHLAHECRKANLAPQDAMMILEDADTRWGKYLMRGESGRLELVKLLERAYGHTPSS